MQLTLMEKSYLIIWTSDAKHYGHAVFAVDNYKYDSQNKQILKNVRSMFGLLIKRPYLCSDYGKNRNEKSKHGEPF